ncbi:MAG: hypothetical protein K2X35_05320 [Bryobacteraceae bacterium]|nr:hypothetical protein [Bryobacteraceae bacterium]
MRPAFCIVLGAGLLTPVLAGDPAILRIRVLEGEGVVYATGSRAARGLTVQVNDETGRPVEMATVSFRLPDDGPSGTFVNKGRTEILTTRADGRAAVWGMQWNRTPGPVVVRVTAVKGKTRAGLMATVFLSDAVPRSSEPSAVSGRRSRKWLWIGLAAAAGGGLFAATSMGRSTPGPTPPAAGIRIGQPSVSLGRP